MCRVLVRSGPLVAVVLVLSLLVAGCGDETGPEAAAARSSATSEPAPVRGGRLTYGIAGETNSWSPAAGQWSSSSWVVANAIFDPLVYYDEDLNLKPFLAESIEPSEDYKVWTITTREGVTFHNGEPFDAAAVKANFEAQKESPLLSAVLAPLLDIEVTGERTVRLTMANSWAHFPHSLVNQPGMMMAPAMIADPEGGRHPIGTGPFAFDEWVPDDHLLVVRNDDYWLAEPYLNEIEFKVMPDLTSRNAAFDAGDIDVSIVTSTPEATKEHEGATVYTSDVGEDVEGFIMLNQLHAPLNDVRVRRALVLATDAEEITQVITGGANATAQGIYAPDSPWYVETDYPDYDPDAAKALVAQLEDELGPIAITLSASASPLNLQELQLIKEQWEAAGVEVELQTSELATYITQTVSGGYDAALFSYHGAGHPDGEFVFLHSQYAAPEGQLGLNFARNVDYQIDEALLEGRYTDDPARLHELYGTVQARMAGDLPYVFIWHVKGAILARKTVHDLDAWTMPDGSVGAALYSGRHRFHQMWVE
jgi:peptide/nickel transport system substrate-binding protein